MGRKRGALEQPTLDSQPWAVVVARATTTEVGLSEPRITVSDAICLHPNWGRTAKYTWTRKPSEPGGGDSGRDHTPLPHSFEIPGPLGLREGEQLTQVTYHPGL